MLDKALNQPEQGNFLPALMTEVVDKFTLQDAINRLRQELQKDKQPGGYYHTWQCNIANCFYDLYRSRYHSVDGISEYHYQNVMDIANKAAENFLEHLCNQTNDNIGLIKQSELQK